MSAPPVAQGPEDNERLPAEELEDSLIQRELDYQSEGACNRPASLE
jgi:hypothetical protein